MHKHSNRKNAVSRPQLIKGFLGAAAAIMMQALIATAAWAAQGTTSIEVKLPNTLIVYHYDNIQLQVGSTALADYLAAGSASACASDFCADLNTLDLRSSPINDLNASNADAQLSDSNPAIGGGSSATFTVENAVGVRALGCTDYAAATAIGTGTDAAVTISSDSLLDIRNAPCSLTMTVGDLVFDVDINSLTTATVNAVFSFVVVGL